MAGLQVLAPSSTTGGRTRRSYRPVAMMWLATARLIAASLPGTGESQWSACVAVLDSRVSSTITFAPRSRPR